MITRFRHEGLKALFETDGPAGIEARDVPKLRRMMSRLDHGPLPDALMLPAYRLSEPKGAGRGPWTAWVSGQLYLTFDIEGQSATEVDLRHDV